MGQLYLEKKKREFLDLKQNNLTVIEYEREFVRLSRYPNELIAMEVEMCRRFEWGLNEDIFALVIALNIQDFSILVETGQRIEEGLNRQKEKSFGKRTAVSSMPSLEVRGF